MDYQHNLSAIHTAVAILIGAGGMATAATFNKAIFYADLDSLLNLGSTISGCRYVALEDGPAVLDYQGLILALNLKGLAEQRTSSILSE